MSARKTKAPSRAPKRAAIDTTQTDAMNAIAYLYDANERIIDAISTDDTRELLSVMSCITAALSHLRSIYPHPVDVERSARTVTS